MNKIKNIFIENSTNMTRNVELIRNEKVRVINGTIPREVRNELNRGIKSGFIGRLEKVKLMPEVFYHPDYHQEAIKLQTDEAIRKTNCLAKILV
jgi:hypothetical protein